MVDIFAPEKGKGARPVLIYVSGGAGNKQQGGPNGDAFYDNVMLWAVKNGMVGVNMQRRPGQTWDDPAKDIAIALFWLNKNIAKFKGNPEAGVHLVAVRRQRAREHLHRSSRVLWSPGSRR